VSLSSRLAPRQPGPPKDITPSALLSKLKQAERPSIELSFPREGPDGKPVFTFLMRVLSQDELDNARGNAEDATRRKLRERTGLDDKDLQNVRETAWSEIYEDAKCCEVLAAAMIEPGTGRPVFTVPSEIRRPEYAITNDELAGLFQLYEMTQHRLGPLWKEMEPGEIDMWIERLQGGMNASPLLDLLPGQLVQLVISMAVRLSDSKTDTGSSGSQLGSGAPGTPSETTEVRELTPEELETQD